MLDRIGKALVLLALLSVPNLVQILMNPSDPIGARVAVALLFGLPVHLLLIAGWFISPSLAVRIDDSGKFIFQSRNLTVFTGALADYRAIEVRARANNAVIARGAVLDVWLIMRSCEMLIEDGLTPGASARIAERLRREIEIGLTHLDIPPAS